MSTMANALQSDHASVRFLCRILLDFATVILCEVRNAPVNDSTARAYLDNSCGIPFNQVCSEFLLLCETLISDDVLKNKQYHAHVGAKRNLENKDNLTKLLFLESRRPTQIATDFEAEEDITVGEHWLAYLNVGKMLYEDTEFQRQVRRIEAIATEQIAISKSKRDSKSPSEACQEAIKCSLLDSQETVELNPNGALSPVVDKAKERGVSGREVSSLKTQASSQHVSLTKNPSIERGLGHRSIWRSAWYNIKNASRHNKHRTVWKRLVLPEAKEPKGNPRMNHTLGTKSDDQKEFASNFFDHHKEFLERHIQPRSTGNYGSQPRVKIAILDTGIEKHDPDIWGRRVGKHDPIKMVKHFGGSEQETDTNGHGTHVAGLVMKIAHHADLYIAKIADNTPQGDEGYSSVVNALSWAIDNAVDIVTMSFGSMERSFGYARLKAEIRRAQEKDIILFAAAPNTSGYGMKAYPASDCNVLCIHAVNGRGDTFGRPKPSVGRNHNHFATLGTGIQCIWDEQPCVKDGNSYANAIAAGFAANVLEYALLQVRERRLSSEVYSNLRHLNGMRIMFGLMAKQDQGEHDQGFVRPWDFWTSDSSPGRICESLSEQLGHFPPL